METQYVFCKLRKECGHTDSCAKGNDA